MRRLALPDIKIYCKVSIIKTVWYCAQVEKMTDGKERRAQKQSQLHMDPGLNP